MLQKKKKYPLQFSQVAELINCFYFEKSLLFLKLYGFINDSHYLDLLISKYQFCLVVSELKKEKLDECTNSHVKFTPVS